MSVVFNSVSAWLFFPLTVVYYTHTLERVVIYFRVGLVSIWCLLIACIAQIRHWSLVRWFDPGELIICIEYLFWATSFLFIVNIYSHSPLLLFFFLSLLFGRSLSISTIYWLFTSNISNRTDYDCIANCKR